MKKYEITGKINNRKVFVKDCDSGIFRELLPDRSQKLRNHSPDGFAWGYGGSGPSQLALALLLELVNDAERVMWHYHSMVGEIISKLDKDSDFSITLSVFRDAKKITVNEYNGEVVFWRMYLLPFHSKKG